MQQGPLPANFWAGLAIKFLQLLAEMYCSNPVATPTDCWQFCCLTIQKFVSLWVLASPLILSEFCPCSIMNCMQQLLQALILWLKKNQSSAPHLNPHSYIEITEPTNKFFTTAMWVHLHCFKNHLNAVSWVESWSIAAAYVLDALFPCLACSIQGR